jgi:hypothetical protein
LAGNFLRANWSTTSGDKTQLTGLSMAHSLPSLIFNRSMNMQTDMPALSSLEYLTYLDENGSLNETYQGKIGVYAIFDRDRLLQFVGYSRDVYLSLKQHLVRQPEKCYWFKVQTIERPSRAILEEMRQAWITENGVVPAGNSQDLPLWEQAIDVKPVMDESEKLQYEQSDELEQSKLLKKVARRLENEIQSQLKARGVTMEIRFNPKLKEQGLLDLK